MTPDDLAHLRRARDTMDRGYTRPLDVLALAKVAHMSPSHFARQFKVAYRDLLGFEVTSDVPFD